VGVVAVIDGDTLLVARGSDVFKVRLRGVDTPELNPESSKPAEALAEEAREFALMAAGLEVGLEFDAACTPDLGPGCVDIYDRPLAYIRLKDGDDLGEALLLAGYAKILVFHDQPFDRLDAYVEAQSAAQSAGLGLWAP
jgi:micrococcal nuclease